MNAPKFRCNECGEGMTSEHFAGHINMHRGVQGFHCPLCPAKYTYKSELYKHRKKNLPVSTSTAVENRCGN
jgi:hypothetical protein